MKPHPPTPSPKASAAARQDYMSSSTEDVWSDPTSVTADFLPNFAGDETLLTEENGAGGSDVYIRVPALSNLEFLITSSTTGSVYGNPVLLRRIDKSGYDVSFEVHLKWQTEPADESIYSTALVTSETIRARMALDLSKTVRLAE